MQLSFAPTVDAAEIKTRLERLLVPGELRDPALESRIDRLGRAFYRYAESSPLPLWAPGLALDNEMRGRTEALFPLAEVRPVFERVLRKGCRFEPLLAGSYLHSSACYPDLLQRLHPQVTCADPAVKLRELMADAAARTRFLFSLMLPQHFGGGFDRYPAQSLWLSEFLAERREAFRGGIRILDSACGSGEGTYHAAELALAAGLGGRGCVVHGSTLEEIELFAAAHLFFPHDPERERGYRKRVIPLLGRPETVELEFYLDRVEAPPRREPYHLVLCNGLLGGPLLHDRRELKQAFSGLASRLLPGGLLLAADRFHAGWRLQVTPDDLAALMRENGLTPVPVPEGIAGMRER